MSHYPAVLLSIVSGRAQTRARSHCTQEPGTDAVLDTSTSHEHYAVVVITTPKLLPSQFRHIVILISAGWWANVTSPTDALDQVARGPKQAGSFKASVFEFNASDEFFIFTAYSLSPTPKFLSSTMRKLAIPYADNTPIFP